MYNFKVNSRGKIMRVAKVFLVSVLVVFLSVNLFGEKYTLNSPDGNIEVNVEIDDIITYKVDYNETPIILDSKIQMHIRNDILGKNPKIENITRSSVNNTIDPVVQLKSKEVKNHYNQIKLELHDNWALYFRAYNDGMAYRFETEMDQQLTVFSESVNYEFTDNHTIYYPLVDSVYSHQERQFKKLKLGEISSDSLSCLPALVKVDKDINVLISEADLYNYPGLYLIGKDGSKHSLRGKIVNYPAETKQINDRNIPVTKYANYIAKINGNRTYPWRYMIIEEEDKELLESQMTYKLSRPLQLEETDWINPGKVAWDWYNARNVYNVDFKAGINTQTYKYYINFAAQHDLDYIILDEGWSNTQDLFDINPNIDVQEIVNYGKKKDVEVILWMLWTVLDDQFDRAFEKFDEWGVKGLKVDFMQRDDQKMVNFYHKVAKKAAKHHLLVNFHGNYKPSGLRRAYPNVITREGVRGLEQCKWGTKANPEHDVKIPFTRMVVGPMDYTPGAMRNATKQNFRPIFAKPMSMGTRTHQLAMYVIYESPLQMLADSPTQYKQAPKCMEFLSRVPTTWDETIVLKGEIGQHVAMARRKGTNWYIGAMNNWDSTSVNIDLSFLDEQKYSLKLYRDGLNADRNANDFEIITKSINKGDKLEIRMAPGGGAAGIIKPE